MTKQHPITPPPELVQQWLEDSPEDDEFGIAGYIAIQAARWGADQELEACCEYIAGPGSWFANPEHRVAELRAARRPKPPSLAEQALIAQRRMWDGGSSHADWELIRAALERLQELENNG